MSVQNERSQAQNKEIAFKILTAKLTDLELKRISEKQSKIKGEYVSAEFGRQVRSYIQHPYQMVKDHRTKEENGNTQAVMDGNLNQFIRAYLLSMINNKGETVKD